MQVEVTAQNIILYGLVELTGNPAEVMLQLAAEAEAEGHVLTCEVPDKVGVDKIIRQNMFDVAGSEPSPEEGDILNPIMNNDGKVLFANGPTVELIDVVSGEVVESHIIEDEED